MVGLNSETIIIKRNSETKEVIKEKNGTKPGVENQWENNAAFGSEWNKLDFVGRTRGRRLA